MTNTEQMQRYLAWRRELRSILLCAAALAAMLAVIVYTGMP